MIRSGVSQCVKLLKVQTKSLTFVPTLHQTLQMETAIPILQFVRATSFFNRLPGEALWKSHVTVSNPGKKKGRGKGSMKNTSINLNRGQRIGVGRANIYWPGLTGPVTKGSEVFTMKRFKKDPNFQENIIKLRQLLGKRKREKLHPLERGWSGNYPKGRKFGPPDPIGDDKFEDFESVLLDTHYSSYMTYDMGRQKKLFVQVAVGNKNGLIGVSKVKGKLLKNCIARAKKRAFQRLMEIKRLNDRTVYHSFCGEFGRTKVFVTKKEEGYGLKCHRVITALCQLMGLTDITAKVEGSKTIDHVIKAFLSGLIQQKTHQELADEKKLHVVEIRRERNYYPNVVGVASDPLTKEEARNDPFTFEEHVHRNKVKLIRKEILRKKPMTFNKERFLRRNYYRRNHWKVILNIKAQNGGIKSHLTQLYPEAYCGYRKPKKEKADAS